MELKTKLSTKLDKEAAAQIHGRMAVLQSQQPRRGAFWFVSAGCDGLRVWKFMRDGGHSFTDVLPFSPEVSSEGLKVRRLVWGREFDAKVVLF